MTPFRSRFSRTALRCVIGCLALGTTLAACNTDEPKPAVTAAKAPAPTKQPERPLPWYQGDWSGTYAAKPFQVQMSAEDGAVKEWGKDDATSFSGEGQLTLSIDASGTVNGTAKGPLGDLLASGEVDGETLRVGLRPAEPTSADQIGAGTVIANRKGDRLEGELRASTGDSLKLRVASLTLSKTAKNAKGAPPVAN